jgi:uncharacterized membrane protein (DUF485 family)
VDEGGTAFPTEEYIAGRERGRTAGLKRALKVRLTSTVALVFIGGGFASVMLASPASTGRTSFSIPIALLVFSGFVVVGIIITFRARHSYRRQMKNLRADIIRSVVTPDDATPQPGRFRRWWIGSYVSNSTAWDRPMKTVGVNENPDDMSEHR